MYRKIRTFVLEKRRRKSEEYRRIFWKIGLTREGQRDMINGVHGRSVFRDLHGELAQLVERRVRNAKVRGSTPLFSTK